MFVNTLHGFADTVRFCVRGLMVDRAVSTAHNRTTRGGALVLAVLCPQCRQTTQNVFRCFSLGCYFAHERRTLRQKSAVSPCMTCVRRSHAASFPNKEHVMAAWRGHEAVGVVSPTVRARPHRESCLFGDDVVDATHLVWLVVASIVCFCEHLRARCGVFSHGGCSHERRLLERNNWFHEIERCQRICA